MGHFEFRRRTNAVSILFVTLILGCGCEVKSTATNGRSTVEQANPSKTAGEQKSGTSESWPG